MPFEIHLIYYILKNEWTFQFQQAVQEKYRLVCESLDSLNSWLEKVEKEISNQETITEEVHELKTQLKTIKVFLLKDFHFLRKLIA